MPKTGSEGPAEASGNVGADAAGSQPAGGVSAVASPTMTEVVGSPMTPMGVTPTPLNALTPAVEAPLAVQQAAPREPNPNAATEPRQEEGGIATAPVPAAVAADADTVMRPEPAAPAVILGPLQQPAAVTEREKALRKQRGPAEPEGRQTKPDRRRRGKTLPEASGASGTERSRSSIAEEEGAEAEDEFSAEGVGGAPLRRFRRLPQKR